MPRQETKVIQHISGGERHNIAGRDQYIGLTAEQVHAHIAVELRKDFQPKPFDGTCPYVGLASFQEDDAERFFGREKLIEELTARVHRSRFVVIAGPSGSGKSSLVRAGLIPALKKDQSRKSNCWFYGALQPGRDPLDQLGWAMSRLAIPGGTGSPEAGDFFRHNHAHDLGTIHKIVESRLSDQADQRALIFCDQFEEVFTPISKTEERALFLNLLTYAATVEGGRLIVVVAMRSDFVPNCAGYPQLNSLLNREFFQVGAMQQGELIDAIERPARQVGLKIENDLIARIINDMKGEPGALPLTQFALKDLFDAQKKTVGLTLKDYVDRGGIHEALKRHADQVLENLSSRERELARNLFPRLIQVRQRGQDTRRTALIKELVVPGADESEVKALVDKLASPEARLVTSDTQGDNVRTVTISHEKLIEAWPWLAKLVAENREAIALQNQIDEAAKEWEAKERSLSYLTYRGERLKTARETLIEKKVTLGALADAFLQAGIKADEEEAKEKEAARQKELRDAETIRRNSVQADFDLALLYRDKSESVHPRTLAHLARALRTQPDASLPRQYLVSLLRDNSWCVPQTDPLRHEHAVLAASFSADGRRIVTASHDGTARVWDAQTGEPVGQPLRHEGTVYAASFSADGRRIVTASLDKTARVWDAQSGEPVGQPLRHEGTVNEASFSADGRRIVTASWDKTARVWDAQSGESVGQPLRHEGMVYEASFSADGRRIVTASDDKTARVWDAQTGEPVGQPLRHEGGVYAASFSADGSRIVTASHDETARVWDAQSREPVGQPLRHEDGVRAASFSRDGRRIVTASWDKTARVWDAQSGESVGQPLRHEGTVIAASFSADGSRIVTASDDKTARVWDAQSGEPVGQPLRHEGGVNAASFSADGSRIVTASRDKTARVWDAQSGESVGQPLRHEGGVYAASFSRDGRRIVTGSDDKTARVWDAQSGESVGQPLRHEGGVYAASFSRDGSRIVTASHDETARVWDAESGEPVGQPLRHEGVVNAASFSADGRRIVTASHDGTARVWDAETGEPVGQPLRHEGGVIAASFSRDGSRIVTASWDKTARVWDAQSGEPVGQPLRHEGTVIAASFSADGSRIVTASDDKTARVWDAQSGEPVGQPLRHEGGVNAASFSADGSRIVTASDDKTARVWDAQSGEPVGQPLRHEGTVRAASFSTDGSRIVTASYDGTARVWDAETGEPVGQPLRHEGGVYAASFSRDGSRIVTASHDGTARIWVASVELKGELPKWLIDLAEVLGGQRFMEKGRLVPSTASIVEFRKKLLAPKGDDFWSRFGRWFFMRGPERAISPGSKVTVRQLAEQCMEFGSEESLDEAERLAAGNDELLAKIASKRSHINSQLDSNSAREGIASE